MLAGMKNPSRSGNPRLRGSAANPETKLRETGMLPGMENPSRPAHPRLREFAAGAKDTIPLLLGAAPFGVVFGAVGVTSGLSAAAVTGFSLFVFAGSAQFVAAGLVTQGMSIPLIVLTTFVVNLRHALYATSLGPYLKKLPRRWLIPLAFWLTDETYAVTIRRLQQEPDNPHRQWYQLGSSVSMYLNWQLWTAVGLFAGTKLAGLSDWGLDFAMAVTFIGIVVPLVRSLPMVLCAAVAGAAAVLLRSLPSNLGLLAAALAGMAAGTIAETLRRPPAAPTEGQAAGGAA
jgi:4-azaleucine resistance transporter AzlC